MSMSYTNREPSRASDSKSDVVSDARKAGATIMQLLIENNWELTRLLIDARKERYKDPLIPDALNIAGLELAFDSIFVQQRRSGAGLFFDLDKFKQINDSLVMVLVT